MRVFCPNCSEPINISDDLAGKATTCPLCKAPFSAPALFTGNSAAPATIKPYTPPAPPPPTETYNVMPPSNSTPAASAPPPAPPPSAYNPPAQSYAPPASSYSPPEAPPPSSPGSYSRRYGFSISPEVIQWLAPVFLGLAVFFTFFSWNGAYPGGHGVYTQGPWRAMFGRIHTDNQGERVMKLNPEKPAEGQTRLEDQVRSNFLLLLFLPLLFGTFALSIFFTLLPKLTLQVPANFQNLVPWRMLVIAGLSLVLIFFLSIVSLSGFGLENALREKAAIKEPLPGNPTDQDVLQREIEEGMALGQYSVQRTTALELEFVALILAAAGAAAAFGMMRRTDKPHPRLEVMC
jgi:hypothetical protein